MKLLLSPHDDDSVLFAAFTCMREKPMVVICTDSFIQPARGEVGCSAVERANESARAHAILGCEVIRLGIPDSKVQEEHIIEELKTSADLTDDTIYAPAIQGGNAHHDMVGRAAIKLFGGKVRQYTTYTKTKLYTTGDIEIVPTKEERRIKEHALLDCYKSQIRINLPHFEAVLVGESEWLIDTKFTEEMPPGTHWYPAGTPMFYCSVCEMKHPRPDLGCPNGPRGPKGQVGCPTGPTGPTEADFKKLHLGCGRDIKRGWINLDRNLRSKVDICADVTRGIPLDDNSIDHVYSQDFLEHLPPESAVPVINEIWRVLKVGGTMEHFVPNAGSQNDFGSPTHLTHWNLQCFEHFDVDSYRWKIDREYEGFIGGFKKILGEYVNWQREEGGVNRAQSIHIIYEKVNV